MKPFIYIIALIIALAQAVPQEAYSAPAPKQQTSKSKQKNNANTKNKKAAAKKQTGSKKSNKKSKGGGNSQSQIKTSADAKKKQQDTQREIKLTEEQIRKNDAEVKRNLADLSKIGADISVSKQQIATIAGHVSKLDAQLSTLQGEIESREARVALMREKYMAAVKKMRMRKGSGGTMAFIFSAGSFNQAMRRMRYLRRFSEWREKQTGQIEAEVRELDRQKKLLAQTKAEKDRMLASERTVKQQLEVQYTKQDAAVATLKKNGDALRSHLARKQAEAYELKSRIATLIAEEQRKAEAQRRADEKARAEAEERERHKADMAQQQPEPAKEETPAPQEQKKQKAKKEKTKKEQPAKKDNNNSKSYADARKRQERKQEQKSTVATTPAASAPKASGFASARGTLPRPASGAFRIVSPFGRHPLPELPDVMYDNPGIDAEVQPGSSAQAVYEGKVSGVYMLKGFATVIIVNHGTHYTVYGNIASPAVKNGDTVKQGQHLGKLVSDPEDNNRTTIHFEVWRGREKLNPAEWIR